MCVPVCYDVKRKWYRNFLMKAFHLCVLLVAGPGVRDTQVCKPKTFSGHTIQLMMSSVCSLKFNPFVPEPKNRKSTLEAHSEL